MTDTVRRNGQLSSCEQCRKAKLRCDHGRPQCGRCLRRSRQCYYHPAPMTQRRPPPRMEPSVSTSVNTPALTTSTSTEATPSNDLDRATGLVGMQSTLMSFGNDDSTNPVRTEPYLAKTGVIAPSGSSKVTPALLAEGVGIIEELISCLQQYDELLCRAIADRGDLMLNGIMIKVVFPAIKQTMEDLMAQPSRSKVYEMSQAIFDTTSRPFAFPLSPADGALMKSLCTPTVRWESVGIYFGTIGLLLAADRRLETVRTSEEYQALRSERNSLVSNAFDVCIKCHMFCERLGQVNDLTLWLLLSAISLCTWNFGDDCYYAWQLMGSLSTSILAMDIHKGSNNNQSLPEYAFELRKRVLALCHEYDKAMSTFVGRPPRLSRYYCTAELPLDLPDSVLTARDEIFQAAKARLDEYGWSQDGILRRTFRERTQLLMSMRREEVLELSLGPPVPNIEERANLALSNLEETWQVIPSSLKDLGDQADMANSIFSVMRIWLRLEYLYTQFLCLKLLIRLSDAYRDKFIEVSHEVLGLVLTVMRSRRWLFDNRNDSEWVMALYAMPCATVLLLELLRQSRHLQPRTHQQQQITINRSTIIKDISALILCCDWLTEQGQGNYEIIKQAQPIFSKGLDQVLNYPTFPEHAYVNRPAGLSTPETPVVASNDADISNLLMKDPEWTTWLESFGLEAEPWFDFNDSEPFDFSISNTSMYRD